MRVKIQTCTHMNLDFSCFFFEIQSTADFAKSPFPLMTFSEHFTMPAIFYLLDDCIKPFNYLHLNCA